MSSSEKKSTEKKEQKPAEQEEAEEYQVDEEEDDDEGTISDEEGWCFLCKQSTSSSSRVRSETVVDFLLPLFLPFELQPEKLLLKKKTQLSPFSIRICM